MFSMLSAQADAVPEPKPGENFFRQNLFLRDF
jgi:hypothetical protein